MFTMVNQVTGQGIELVFSNDTIWGYQTEDVIEFKASVKNNNSSDVSITLTKVHLNIPQKSNSAFCFGEGCYDSQVFTSDPNTVSANSTTHGSYLKGQYFPNWVIDTAEIEYLIVDQTHADTLRQKVVFITSFDPNTGLNDFKEKVDQHLILLNQSIQFYNESIDPVDIEVLDFTGASLSHHVVEPSSTLLQSFEDQPSGIYLISVTSNNLQFVKRYYHNR